MNLLRWCRARNQRMRMATFALLALLLQQVALVAYACPLESLPATPVAMTTMTDCDMSSIPDPPAPLLCDQHCQRDHVATPDLKLPHVPALATTHVHFTLAEALLPPIQALAYENIPVCRSDPPAAQRFCSLQI